MIRKLVLTSDGSHTLYVPGLDEHYHSVHGAVQESRHIFIQAGYRHSAANPVRIFEAGFGTGLNAVLTALESTSGKRETVFTTIEKFPLGEDIINTLNHGEILGAKAAELYARIHNAPWGVKTAVTDYFILEKRTSDLVTDQLQGEYDLIYFDAFGPEKQPEMWSIEVFRKLSSISVRGTEFVTYSSRGQVKRNLRACGFRVELLPGPPGKRQIIRAVKI